MTSPAPTAPAALAPSGAAQHDDEPQLSPRHGETLVRLAEAAAAVSRRAQFFVWTQGPLHALLPHAVLCCGSYARPRRALGYTVFHSVLLSPAALAPLGDAHSALLRACAAAWVQAGARALLLDIEALEPEAREDARRLGRELPGLQLIVHGVARPQRPAEIESLFVFLASQPADRPAERLLHTELLLPYLHGTWRRVHAAEASLGLDTPGGGTPGDAGRAAASLASLTEREREILRCAREGKSNLEIGVALDISALTVKNHIQKILRKLGASNRAHAVALAMSQGLL